MKCVIICLMALYAFQIVFADLNPDFLEKIKNLSLLTEKNINTRVAVAKQNKINIGNCKDTAVVELQDALFKRQKQAESRNKGNPISDFKNDIKSIWSNLQACINNCTKTKNCNDD